MDYQAFSKKYNRLIAVSTAGQNKVAYTISQQPQQENITTGESFVIAPGTTLKDIENFADYFIDHDPIEVIADLNELHIKCYG